MAGLSILFVCTGNICRSPLAERYTEHRLVDVAPDVAGLVLVGSVGVRGLEGHPMDPPAEAELNRHGGRGSGFVGRRLCAAHVESAGLVLAMTRAQRAAALAGAPSAPSRAFTLLEAAALARLVAADAPAGGAPPGPAGLVAAMAARRSGLRLESYDVADPFGRTARVHAAVADVIVAAVDVLVAALVPTLRDPTATPGHCT